MAVLFYIGAMGDSISSCAWGLWKGQEIKNTNREVDGERSIHSGQRRK